MPKARPTKKIMKGVMSLVAGSMIGAFLANAQGASDDPVREKVSVIAEEIEQREEIDRLNILSLESSLPAACKAHAIRYSGSSHDLARAKIEMILGEREVGDWPEPSRDEFGKRYLDGGCSSRLLLQLINRHHELKRFVNDGLLSLTTGAVL